MSDSATASSRARRQISAPPDHPSPKIPHSSPLLAGVGVEKLKSLKVSEIRALLADEAITKPDLVELGSIRFGAPRARLMRMPLDELKQHLDALVSHEASLDALSEQAERHGMSRRF